MADKIKDILGLIQPLKIGERQIDIKPIRLKDWPKFASVMFALELEVLNALYMYPEAEQLMGDLFKICTREEEIPEIFNDMTQADYENFRKIVIEQNGVDFNYLEKRRIERDSKKAPTLPSP